MGNRLSYDNVKLSDEYIKKNGITLSELITMNNFIINSDDYEINLSWNDFLQNKPEYANYLFDIDTFIVIKSCKFHKARHRLNTHIKFTGYDNHYIIVLSDENRKKLNVFLTFVQKNKKLINNK